MEDWNCKLKNSIKKHNKSIPDCMIYSIHSAYTLSKAVYEYYEINRIISEENILGLFIDFYNKILNENAKTVFDIDTILNVDTMLELSVKNNIIGAKHNYIYKELLYYENEKKMIKNDKPKFSDRTLVEIFVDTDYETGHSIAFTELHKNSTSRAEGFGIMIGTAICYIKALVKYIFLVTEYSILIAPNDDLLMIYRNLIYSNNLDISTTNAIEKTYEIYSELYQDKFDCILNLAEFGIVLTSKNIDINYQNTNFVSKEIDEGLRFFIVEISQYCPDYNLIIDNNLIHYIAESSCDKNGTKDLENSLYIEKFYETVHCLSKSYLDKIDLYNFLKIVSSLNSNIKEYEKSSKKRALKRERDRLLAGNMCSEIEYYKDKNMFENIKKGEDFEKYLGNLYEKLGYKVCLTKKTCDQGADLIIEKNNKKTVIQAKYYSGSVGNKAVQEVIGAIKYYSADNAIVVTNSYFTSSAIELAKCNEVELIDGSALNSLRRSVYKF